MSSQLFFQVQSILIVCLMTYGITQRFNRQRHVKIMASSMLWDIVLILQIELSRSAILKTARAMTEKPNTMLHIHLFFALSTVILYIFVTLTGRKLLKREERVRKTHRILGITTFTFRVLTLITSFFAVSS